MKYITVIILNWLRPNNIKDYIIPEITKCPIVKQIIISHGREDTYFEQKNINNVKIHNRKDFSENKVFGLSLRFIAALDSIYENILYVDDDILPHPATIINIFNKYQQNYPCIVGRYGRKILKSYEYSSKPRLSKRCPILLTSLVLVPKKLCYTFLDKMETLYEFVLKSSNPLWNGEDIFLSFLSIYTYQKLPYLVSNPKYFPVNKLDNNLEVAISRKPGHIYYRSLLIKEIINNFGNCSNFNNFFAPESVIHY